MKDTIDQVLEGLISTQHKTKVERKPITVWVSEDCKEKYDQIQKLSGRIFSSKIKQIFAETIDRAYKKLGE